MAGSRLYDHCEAVWRAMYAEAIPVGQLSGQDRYLAGMVPLGSLGIWLGALTRLCEGLGLPSTSQYHQVKGALVRMGTIAQLRRGTAHQIGAWALWPSPPKNCGNSGSATRATVAGAGPTGAPPARPRCLPRPRVAR
jgi:hypothetical protein